MAGGALQPNQSSFYDPYGGVKLGAINPGSGTTDPSTTLNSYGKQLNTAPQDYSNILAKLQAQVGQTTKANSPELGAAMSSMEGNLATGGYSDQDIQDIRARAISPIRSIYMNAMNNIGRQRSLQGGYSPNYTAAMTNLARGLSGQIADTTTNVNAGLAQNIVGNRMQAAGQLAPVAASSTGSDLTRAIQALSGQTSLFGTSPGMLNTLGNQTLQAQNLSDQQQRYMDQMNQQNQLAELAALTRQ